VQNNRVFGSFFGCDDAFLALMRWVKEGDEGRRGKKIGF
jgi:hypothetical protein